MSSTIMLRRAAVACMLGAIPAVASTPAVASPGSAMRVEERIASAEAESPRRAEETGPTLAELRASAYELILGLPGLDDTANLSYREKLPESTHVTTCAGAHAVKQKAAELFTTAAFVEVIGTVRYPDNELHLLRRSQTAPRFIDRVIFYFSVSKQSLLECRNTFGYFARREYANPGQKASDAEREILLRDLHGVIDAIVSWLGRPG